MLFDKVTREHILDGIKDFETKGMPEGFGPSSTYDLEFNGKKYPPKAIMAYSNFHAIGREIENYFAGGEGTDCFNSFERNGFTIDLKVNEGMKEKFEKWLHNNTKEGSNRVSSYLRAIELLNEILDYNIYETNDFKILNDLYEELIVDQKTIGGKYYVKKSPSYGTNGFYSASIKKYIEFLKEQSEGLGFDSVENNLKNLISSYKRQIRSNKLKDEKYKWEFISEYEGRPDPTALDFEEQIKSFKWNNLTYQLSGSVLIHIVNDRPVVLRNLFNELFNNSVPLEQRIKQWDKDVLKVYRELNGEHSHHQDERAISVYLTLHNPNQYTFYKSSYYKKFCDLLGVKPKMKGQKYVHYMELINMFVDDYISNDQELIDLIASIIPEYYDGSNNLLLAQDILYQMLEQNMVKESTNFEELLKQYNHDDLTVYFSFLFEILDRLNIEEGDDRILYSTTNDNLAFTIGQRYSWGLFKSNSKGKFGVLSSDILRPNSELFKGNPRAYYTHFNEVNFIEPDKNSIFKGFEQELNRSNKTSYRKHNNSEFERAVFEKSFRAQFVNTKSMERENIGLNKILFGPPGTGKTYRLKKEYFPQYITKGLSISSEQNFENVVRECSWWQVIAIALLKLGKSKVSDIADHEWVAQKAKLSNSNTVRPTIWGQLQSHTIESCEFVNVKSKQQPFIFNKTKDSFWEILEEEVKEQIPEIFDIIDSVDHFDPDPDKEIQRYVFTTFHQSYSYEDFIEGIKPVMLDGEENGHVRYTIEDGVFKQLCKRAETDPNNRYAIFIDEINRGNVSAIFGELITLIEPDKRKDAKNALSAVLPYSKKQFSVPSNVDIYGTMNTADRSVEALDTALRRRFTFEEILPNPKLLSDKGENSSGKVGEIVLETLLSTINDRIEALVDRDHTIGHAFFMEIITLDDLRHVFANKIIPLLQEYFYGDYAKMEMVIGPDFFNKEKRSKKVVFAVSNDDFEILQVVYELINIMDTQFDIEEALIRLLNNK